MPNEIVLAPDVAVTPVAVSPGGAVVIRGAWNVASRDLVIDGCQSGRSSGGATGEGAFNYAAGGWRLRSRDWASHTCELVATGETGSVCALAGVPSPCLPSRLDRVALAEGVAVAELREGISGGLRGEVLSPAVAAVTAPPTWTEQHAGQLVAGAGAVAVALAVAVVGARALARRRAATESQVRSVASRVRARLRGGDPVYTRLAPLVDELARQADELASLRDRLRARVLRADRASLERRRDELAKGQAPEAAEARALVDEQLARVDRWQSEGERAAARLDRVLEYLRALDARLDDALEKAPERERVRVKLEDDARVIQELERDVEAALEGAREADKLVGRA